MNMMMKIIKLAGGFSLIELLIVLVIIAVAVGFTAPRATRSDEHQVVVQLSLNLKESIKYVIDSATNEGRPHRIVFFHKQNFYRLESAIGDDYENYAPMSGQLGNNSYLGSSIASVETEGFEQDGDTEYLIFDPAMPWPRATITVVSENSNRAIKIEGAKIFIDER